MGVGRWEKCMKGVKSFQGGKTSSYKMNKPWGCKVQHGDHSWWHRTAYLKAAASELQQSSSSQKRDFVTMHGDRLQWSFPNIYKYRIIVAHLKLIYYVNYTSIKMFLINKELMPILHKLKTSGRGTVPIPDLRLVPSKTSWEGKTHQYPLWVWTQKSSAYY